MYVLISVSLVTTLQCSLILLLQLCSVAQVFFDSIVTPMAHTYHHGGFRSTNMFPLVRHNTSVICTSTTIEHNKAGWQIHRNIRTSFRHRALILRYNKYTQDSQVKAVLFLTNYNNLQIWIPDSFYQIDAYLFRPKNHWKINI